MWSSCQVEIVLFVPLLSSICWVLNISSEPGSVASEDPKDLALSFPWCKTVFVEHFSAHQLFTHKSRISWLWYVKRGIFTFR